LTKAEPSVFVFFRDYTKMHKIFKINEIKAGIRDVAMKLISGSLEHLLASGVRGFFLCFYA